MLSILRSPRARRAAVAAGMFSAGYACGGGGGEAVVAAMNRIELGGASLAELLSQAGPPEISPGLGVAERVADDGTRHFTVAVATENRSSRSDAAALYALMDGHGAIGGVWGANVLAFAHGDMTSGAVQGLEIDVGNLGAGEGVPVTALNLFAMGDPPSDVALGILNAPDAGAGPGGFREGIAFRSNAPGVAVREALVRVHPGFGTVATGIDLREATFTGPAIATPGFEVDAAGALRSQPLATGAVAFACVDAAGRVFASPAPCDATP
ncbi:MAG TPA: hypothetical protein VFD92_06710 [Candidatus Binatia bacterium]|nr:hypothetical protein [Candidatus Binatia bacterium]